MKSSPFLISLMLMGAGLANASLLRTYGDESSFLAALYPNP